MAPALPRPFLYQVSLQKSGTLSSSLIAEGPIEEEARFAGQGG